MKRMQARIGLFVCSTFLSAGLFAQVVLVTNPTNAVPNLAATYTSLATAINALNLVTTISGPVIITLNSGNPQTAPAGGYSINFTAGTTAARYVEFNGKNNVITASALHTPGSLSDAVFKIIGCDFVTIEGFTIRENVANTVLLSSTTNDMTEWGIALLRASTTNGAQDNTIIDNDIQLNKAYGNSFGIYSNTRHTAIAPTVAADITSTAGANSSNNIYSNIISNVNFGIAFIGSGVAANMDASNDIGGTSVTTGNTISNWGGLTQLALSVFVSNAVGSYAIFVNNQRSERVGRNTITSATLSGTSISVRGIYKSYSINPTGTFTSNITSNVVTINHSFSSGILEGILSDGINTALATATINITSNRFQSMAVMAANASTTMVCISNTSDCGVLNINSNIFRGNTSTATSGGFTGISNTGDVQTTISINNNLLGDASGNAITFSASNNSFPGVKGIACSAAGNMASLSISGNNFQGFVHSVNANCPHTYISFVHAPATATTDNINSNTFTNLNVNTIGAVTFIQRSGDMLFNAGATENCNNNSIVTAFNQAFVNAGLCFYTASSNSQQGNTMVQTGNNFSNVTSPNAISSVLWNNSEGGNGFSGPTKIISNNNFSNINLGMGFGDMTVIQVDRSGDNSMISGNTISNITGSSNNFTGIILNCPNFVDSQSCLNNNISGIVISNAQKLYGIRFDLPHVTVGSIGNNTIHDLSSTSFSNVEIRPIAARDAGVANIYGNKIYDISAQSGKIYGMDFFPSGIGSLNFNVYNNIIGRLYTPFSFGDNMIRGINIEFVFAFYNIYYNTIYLDASSNQSSFGTSGIYFPATGEMKFRNNIVVNISTSTGTGFTVAYRHQGSFIGNYDPVSNNNIFYAGIPSSRNLIYYDVGDFGPSIQTIYEYKTKFAPADSNSYTGMLSFLSTVGSSPDFLHINPAIPSLAESRAVNIATYTDDFDTNIRQGNTGYVGAGTGPDIGADEFAGTFHETYPPIISYTPLPKHFCVSAAKTINAVITDTTGIPLTGALKPRIYYRKNAGSWFSAAGTNTGGTATNSTWSFTIVNADMGGVVVGDVIYYYIVAQDNMQVPNIGSNPSAGLDAVAVNDVRGAPTAPKASIMIGSLGGTYLVGNTGNFTNLMEAIDMYNNCCTLTAPVIFEIGNILFPFNDTFPVSIFRHLDASAVKTLTIRPQFSASINIWPFDSTTLFKLDGARHIIFDGRQGSTGTTKNLFLGGGSKCVFQFVNDAQNNTIKYCSITSSGFFANPSADIIFDSASVTGTGNDNNIIDNNDFTVISLGNGAVYSAGTATRGNDNNSITNNNISGKTLSYIDISSNSSGWTITGNRLYQPNNEQFGSVSNAGIRVSGGSGYTISNNIIGFANTSGTGRTNLIGNNPTLAGFPTAYTVSGTSFPIRYTGILCSFDAAGVVSNINGNTIAGFGFFTSSNASTQNGVFCGIAVLSGNANIGTVLGNSIGSTTGNNSIYVATTTTGGTVVGIYANSSNTVTIQNNNIGGILASGTTNAKAAGVTGISLEGTGTFTISNNNIGNTTNGNIQAGYAISGAQLSNTGTLTSTTGTSSAITGILCTATGNNISITGNTFRGWTTSGTVMPIKGIETSGAMAGTTPAISVNNNLFGTTATSWINYVVANGGGLTGISVSNTNATQYNITSNIFKGVTYSTSSNNSGNCKMIFLSGATSANATANVNTNTFSNLVLRGTTNYFIHTNYSMPATGIRNIIGNQVEGSNTIKGTFLGIYADGSSANLSWSNITDNFLDNVGITAAGSQSSFIYENDGFLSATDAPIKKIENNTISNISCIGDFSGMIIKKLGSQSVATAATIGNNSIIDLLVTDASLTGIDANISGIAFIDSNDVGALAVTGSVSSQDLIGIAVNGTGNGINSQVSSNTMHGFNCAIDNCFTSGMMVSGTNFYIQKNKIYDISGAGASANVNGMNFGYTAAASTVCNNILAFNNLIGDIKAPAAGTTLRPSVAGIDIVCTGSVDIVANSIHLSTSSTHPSFSSAAVTTTTSATVNLKGNMFSNQSTPGASGRTIGHWRNGSSISNFNTVAGGYNNYYCGTSSAQRVIYFDGTVYQTIGSYTIAVPPDNASVGITPSFLSSSGSNVNFLHLNPLTSCGLIGIVPNDNANPLSIDHDVDDDARPTSPSPAITDVGADDISKTSTWTGAVSSNWNNDLNWSLGAPNSKTMRAVIPAVVVKPIINTGNIFQVRDITINAGSFVTNKGTLRIAGKIIAPVGSINNIDAGVVTGSIEMNGLCLTDQSVAGNVFANNDVKDLTITSDVSVSVISGQGVNVHGALGFGAGSGNTFSTGDNITLRSTVSRTANVADLTGNFISGQVTVERYINTGLVADGRHGKSWQFLATPTTGQSIRQSWQESGATPAGFGTIVTGTGTGFDITTALPSLKTYNDVTNGWNAVTNTNNALQEKLGYMIFVRGDRTVTTVAAAANPTTLRSKGILFQPSNPPASVAVAANKFQTFGNPYASRIEFTKVRAASTGIHDVFYVWDPLVVGSFGFGGYQTITGVAGYVPTVGVPPTGNPATTYYPAGVPVLYIESGQAVFVKAGAGGGNLNFSETVKAAGSRLVNKGTNNNDMPGRGFIFSILFTGTGDIADGNIVAFENGLGNDVNENDAMKMLNAGENFGIISNDSLLAVEARDEVNEYDTIFYNLQNLKQLPYQFRFAAINMPATITGYLIDRFTNSSALISMSDSSFVNFNITVDPASAAADRFILVFKRMIVTPVKIISISANKNSNKNITVNWKVENELQIDHYEVERSGKGNNFVSIGLVQAVNNNGGTGGYSFDDIDPLPENFYRIKAIGKDGLVNFSKVVRISFEEQPSTITVYPNPVTGQLIKVYFNNQPAGNYKVTLVNEAGQLVLKDDCNVTGANDVKIFKPSTLLPAGNYALSIISFDGRKTVEKIILQ